MLIREYKLHQQRVKTSSQSGILNALSEMSVLTDEMRERGLISETISNAPWIAEKVLDGVDISQSRQANNPEAQYRQALVFAATNDNGQSLKWLLRAAEGGHSEALYMLGFAHIEGKVERDMAECCKWLTLSANMRKSECC